MWLALALVLSAWGGSYGAATVDFPGFRASIDASVGSWSDPAEEIRAFEEAMEQGRRRLAEHDALLKAAFARYAEGDHRYARLRRHLVPLTADAPTVWAGLAVGDLWFGIETIRIDLPVAASLSKVQREKLAADFALAQIGGTLPPAPTTPSSTAGVASLQAQLGARAIVGVSGTDLPSLLLVARLTEPDLRALAKSPEPVPPGSHDPSYARPGWAMARVLVALLDGASPRAALPDLAGLPDDPRANLIRFVGLALPDDDLDAGSSALIGLSGALQTRRDGPLAAWIEAIAR